MPRPHAAPDRFVRGNERLQRLLEDPARAERVDAIGEEMVAEDRTHAMSLAAVRKASELTQVVIAQRLGVTQGVVSRIESRHDVLLSTLLSYLEAADVHDVALTATVAGRRVHITLAEAQDA